MNLTIKLSLPILFGLLLAMGYLHLYWEPRQLAAGKTHFTQHNRELLASSESAIIRDLLEGNFAALIANVEYLQKKQEGVWFNMEIFSSDGKRLYPLFASPKIASGGRHDFIHENHILDLAQSTIGRISLDIDWNQEKQKIRADVAAVRNLLLGMVMFSLLAILFIQWRIILQPLLRLSHCTRKIAEGNLEIELPRVTRDEVGRLTQSFEFMIQELSFKQYALDCHANVYITDSQGRLTYINDNFRETSGYTKEELLGQNLQILRSDIHPQDFYENMWKTISTGKIWKQEICNRKKSGEYYWQDMTIVPQLGKANTPERFIAISTDISQRKKTEAELVESRLQAEAANLAKSRFLANMSHEFRTPLNSVIGLTQMMSQRQGLSSGVMEEVSRIHIAGQMLLSLVNDILDLSKIEAGEINLEMVPMQLAPVLDELAAILLPQAEEKGLQLVIDPLPPLARGYLICDPTRLRQMLLNLLNNAIKFTSSGSVSLTVEANNQIDIANDGTQHLRLRFLIKDTGCGIPPDLLPTLFDAFRQADSSITRQYGGTGLGLAIVKQLCGEMHGEVQVEESVVGKGSCFSIVLQLRQATDAEVKAAGLQTKQFNILLAEDDPDHCRELVNMCNQLGWNVDQVTNGLKLVHRYEKMVENEKKPDCLIADWQMPELDGLTAISAITEKFGAGAIPAILMIHASDSKQLQQHPHAQVPDLIMTKPCTISDLINGLGAVFSKHGEDMDLVLRSSTLDFAHLAWLPGVKILVVDDAQVNLDLADRLFSREGAEVFNCMDGAEALAWLQSPDNSADIVLMDIQMPVMDGNSAVREIRRIPALRGLPVIALTAAALASERKISLEAGMDDYQTKPYDTEKMVRLIRRYVGQSRGAPVPVREKPPPPKERRDWPDIEGIEPDGVRERLNDDLELFLELLHRFTSENQDLLQPVKISPNHEDRLRLMSRMHKIAGSAGLIGAVDLFSLAKKVENCLQSESLEEVPSLLTQFHENYSRLVHAIRPALLQNNRENSETEAAALDYTELTELIDALKKKKILSTKMYKNLRPALRASLKEEEFTDLDEAMSRLDFTVAMKCLERLQKATS